ncbi:hypothetical protein AXF11_10210 [Leptotrichia sp. oral taxon 847]|nr:hypothetical protein AXF11_10210 [Leptotrichia sp. oral taxon 847]
MKGKIMKRNLIKKIENKIYEIEEKYENKEYISNQLDEAREAIEDDEITFGELKIILENLEELED